MAKNKYSHLIKYAEKYRDLIFACEKYIWENPETGYREWKTSAYLEKEFEKLGYELNMAGNIPGFYTTFDTGKPGPVVLIFGELDSLICVDHPHGDKETGAVHACGHHAQCAALLGIAAVLKKEDAANGLCGKIKLCAVPAEELIEIGYRETLREKGIIKYFGGKVEFLYRGYFDDVDMAFMFHTTGGDDYFSANRGSNGCVVKNITFEGVASHAGGAPHLGINALYAANQGMQAVNALRETFKESDHIRVHPIVTSGGTAVNAIPQRVTMESYVRGAGVEAIKDINIKVNRAFSASAASLGAKYKICDRPGYTPLLNDKNLLEAAHGAMKAVACEDKINISDKWSTGCTDMGDISAVMPAIHPYVGGAEGLGHGNDYRIRDREVACVKSAACQLVLLNMLLSDGALLAKKVIEEKDVRYDSIKAFFEDIDGFFNDKDSVVYRKDGKILLDFV